MKILNTIYIVLFTIISAAILLDSSLAAAADQQQTQTMPQTTSSDLAGTSWQFVKFQGGDEKAITPDEKSKYTIKFNDDGTVNVRFDCNRGRGTWKSLGPNQLEFGPMALTRAMCPSGSLHDHFVKNWPYVRSYILKDGHLFLSLQADGGIYEFEPMKESQQ